MSNPKCKQCRREGEKLFLKGELCYTPKCPMVRKKYAPGMHGQKGSRLTEYGEQLRGKQKAKKIYGIREKQFRNYFKKAERKSKATASTFYELVERRFDNIVYRLGFAKSRDQAKKFISHEHFLVNNKKVNISSYQIKPRDTIRIRKKSKDKQVFQEILAQKGSQNIPNWLSFDKKKVEGVMIAVPSKQEQETQIDWAKICEFYSR
ncbi:30S ribosomal protein S4 [bacterium (Candidatus Torokbacteria) CG_4_10_14_0_2_um_filter_35_8]|nr:MAG: 30S ribosomal protein S4 [bacterium (Candidatus Torokbacteria) CG_4_10_14_0_2_um_filter_35_8]